MHFSKIFGINLDQSQLDFVDITPDKDLPLFIDPFAISLKNDEWSNLCHQHINHFFQTSIDYIRSGHNIKAQELLNGLSEPNETCLGLSKGIPSGRGVAGKQAFDIYNSLAASNAAKTGLLSELAECDLFIPGIGSDKISDITTNIIRLPLIKYTHDQCKLHGIKLVGSYPSGRYWDMNSESWKHDYVQLPIHKNKKLILTPKYTVRRKPSLNSQEFYSKFILNFIQEEEIRRNSEFVRILKNGDIRPPSKESLKDRFPFSKDFLERFSRSNPDVLNNYKKFYELLEKNNGAMSNKDFDENFDENNFAKFLIKELSNIPSGNDNANKYHEFIIGSLEFIFWPHLITPKKEHEINEGRKRIDITYTNAAQRGFFYRAHTSSNITSNIIMVECKNYTKEINNPELDQLSGRFSTNRGRLGLLLYRDVSDYDKLCERCKDTANDGRGFIIPIGDKQIKEFLNLISENKRDRIDEILQNILYKLIS